MDTDLLRKEFHEYAERMKEIKRLSSPDIRKADNADDYSTRLQNNFKDIGRLAAINRQMLDKELYPMLESSGILDESIAEELETLADELSTVAGADDDFENQDLPITSLITERLLKDAEDKNDISLLIRRMDAEFDVCYSLMNMTERIISNPIISKAYRDKGIAIGNEFHKMLDKDFFVNIPDMECRKIVLTDSRFMTAFYERADKEEESNRDNINILEKAYNISNDAFYHSSVSDFDWTYFKFRVLEYYVQCTDIDNARGLLPDQLSLICDRGEELDALCKTDPSYFESINGGSFYEVNLARCRYLAGKLSKPDYKKYLIDVYEKCDKTNVSIDGVYFNVLLPLEIICQIDRENLSSYEMSLVKSIYQSLCAYVFVVPTGGTMSIMMGYFSEIVNRFIEMPGSISLEAFLLRCLAAFHPPTYVHSMMVGQITERLCFYLLKYKPEQFIGFPECYNISDINDSRQSILQYAYNAALYHDSGKIFIIDTILVYGRKLLDFEFDLIKSHPEMGYELLRGHSSTAKYAEVALLHHKWYDDSKGYPFDRNSADSKYKTIIDLVQCADCLDAATDTVGRSYNKGKNVSGFMEELKEGSGTRYAPWLYELFEHKDVVEDIEYLLDAGRKKNYKETYNLLRDVQERNV